MSERRQGRSDVVKFHIEERLHLRSLLPFVGGTTVSADASGEKNDVALARPGFELGQGPEPFLAVCYRCIRLLAVLGEDCGLECHHPLLQILKSTLAAPGPAPRLLLHNPIIT